MSLSQPASRENPLPISSWRREIQRVLAIAAAASILGLITNALNEKPVPLFVRDGPGAPPERARRMSAVSLKAALSDGRVILILDVRGEDAFAAGHPQFALNAPATNFIDHYAKLNLSTLLLAAEDIVLLCESDQCPSADRAAKQLAELGHKNTHVLQDGWTAYRAAGLPLDAPRQTESGKP